MQRALRSFSCFATISLVSAWLLLPTNLASKPVVFATDIGGDVDDTWALAHIMRSKELDLKMVLTETGEAEYRARVAAKVLQVAERENVTVALGKDFGIMPDSERHQGPWVKNYKLSDYKGPIEQDGVRAFIDFVESSEETVTVIAVGPVPSLAAAIEQRPEIAKKCDFFGMFGSFYLGYDGSKEISAEYNVANNVEAFREVIGADWQSITLTPLDTCGIFFLSGEEYQEIWQATSDPLLNAVIENYCIWAPRVPWIHCDFFTLKSSTLFDDVAVYMAYDGSLLNYETLHFNVSDEGKTLIDANGKYHAQVATSWKNRKAFERFLTDRLLGN